MTSIQLYGKTELERTLRYFVWGISMLSSSRTEYPPPGWADSPLILDAAFRFLATSLEWPLSHTVFVDKPAFVAETSA